MMALSDVSRPIRIAPIARRQTGPLVLALCATLAAMPRAYALEPEQDTRNGVAAVKPGEPAAATAPKAEPTTPETTPPAPHTPPTPATADTAPKPADLSGGNRYCENIAAVAAEARFAWQTKKLTELQTQVGEKITALEARQAELKASLTRRDEVMQEAKANLIGIYGKMKADTAAAQLSVLDDETAAAVLAQLNPRQSGAILDEIKPDRAKHLIDAMINLSHQSDKEGRRS